MFKFLEKKKSTSVAETSDNGEKGSDYTKYPELRYNHGLITRKLNTRPAYVWGVLCGVDLARSLNYPEVSVIEFGVAGGNGLIELEKIAVEIESLYQVKIHVYGFDTGTGLPKPCDYRDLPQHWSAGHFKMDEKKLREQLQRAHLVIGPVNETIPAFIKSEMAPVAFASFDMDFYSSTASAFNLFTAEHSKLLPRIYCYFDDIFGFSYCDFNGERLAINEFNEKNSLTKIAKIHGLKYFCGVKDAMWPEQMFLVHLFNHEKYDLNDGMVQFDHILLGKGRHRSGNFKI